jgi:hypothetical protein
MRSSLQAALLAGTAALAVALGAVAAHADESDALAAAQQHAASLDAATGGNNIVSKAVKDPDFADTISDLANSDEAKGALDAMVKMLGDE